MNESFSEWGAKREEEGERERERCWRGGEWRGHQQQEGEGERAVNPTRTALSNFLVPSKGPLQAVQSPLLSYVQGPVQMEKNQSSNFFG